MNSQGTIGAKTLLAIILVVVAFLIVLPLVISMLRFVTYFSQGGMCLASAAVTSGKVSSHCVTKDLSAYNFQCDRRHVSVRPEQATLLHKGQAKELPVSIGGKAVVDYGAVTPDVAESVVSDELVACWNQFARGEVELFRQGKTSWWDRFAGEQNHATACYVCSEIIFEGLSDAEKQALTATDLHKHIEEASPAGSEETYLKILNNPKAKCEKAFWENGDTCWSAVENYFTKDKSWLESFYQQRLEFGPDRKHISRMGQIDPEKGQLVVFIRKRFDLCEGDEEKAADYSNFVYVIPQDELNEACDVVLT